MTKDESERLRSLLIEMGASDADPDGYREISCADGGKFGISAGGIDAFRPWQGFDIEIYELTNDVTSSIFRLAQSANMAICSSTDPKVAALTCPPQSELVQTRWPGAPVITTSKKLGEWMISKLFTARR